MYKTKCAYCKKKQDVGDYSNTKICTICEQIFCFDCNHIALCWCQSVECICKSCILKSKDLDYECKKCGKNVATDMSDMDYPTVVGDSDNIRCMECLYKMT